MLERNIGYFATAAGPAECIIHLYRWDSYEDGKQRIAAIATPERAEYFAAARNLMLAQETMLLDPAPIAELNPLWNGSHDWLPGDPPFRDAADANTLAIFRRACWISFRADLPPIGTDTVSLMSRRGN